MGDPSAHQLLNTSHVNLSPTAAATAAADKMPADFARLPDPGSAVQAFLSGFTSIPYNLLAQ
eukprot:scaffold193616_cov33-Prasinocladus_malaysianus.AAC.1